MNFPGAALLKGGDNPKPDFYWYPVQGMPSDWTLTGVSAAGAVPTVLTTTLAPTASRLPLTGILTSVSAAGPWHWTPWDKQDALVPTRSLAELAADVWKAGAQVIEPETLGTTDIAREPLMDAADAEVSSSQPLPLSVANEPRKLLRSFRARRAVATQRQLTDIAVFIAGRQRADIGCEWRSHLAGETGAGLPTDRQVKEASGFVLAAIRYRIQDAMDLLWRSADAILASRGLSSLVALIATLGAAVISIHGEGLYGLVTNLANIAVAWGMTYGLIRTGRWWRDVKPPERKPRAKSD